MTWKHRYSVLLVLFGAYLLCYLDRMAMASAIPFIAQDFGLSAAASGLVLSAFFVGYALAQIPGGLLADRFGVRGVLTASIGWWSIMTALTAATSALPTMLLVRALFGLGEGPFPAAASKALAAWFPSRELARANGLQLAATAVGASLAPLIVTSLVISFGWRAVFYVLSVPGLVVGLLVWHYVRNSPQESRRVSPEELRDYGGRVGAHTSIRASLRLALSTPAILWCAACMFIVNMVQWGLLNWLPTYLLQERGFGVEKMGVFTAIANSAAALGYPLGGYLCDRYFAGKLNRAVILSLIVSAVATYLAAIAPSGEWAVFYLALTFLVSGIIGTAIVTLPLTVVPNHCVGAAFGVVNTAGQIAGIASPLLVGNLLDAAQGSFDIVFYCLVGMCVLAILPATRIRQTPQLATL